MPVVFSYDESQPFDTTGLTEQDPEEIAAGIAERRAEAMRNCGHWYVRFNKDHQKLEPVTSRCKIRGCPMCDHIRATQQLSEIKHAVYQNPGEVYVLETTEEGLAELVASNNLKKKQYKRIPRVDGVVTVFLHTTTPPPAAKLLNEVSVEQLDWDAICDTPYRERDGETVKISGNLGKAAPKPKLDNAPLTEERSLTFYHVAPDAEGTLVEQRLQRSDYEDLVTEVMISEIQQPMPTSYEDVVVQAERIETALVDLAKDKGLIVKTKVRQKRFTNTIEQIQRNYRFQYRKWAEKLVAQGKIKAIPAHLHPLT